MEGENSKLQQPLNTTKNSSDYYRGLLDGAEKIVENERMSHKNALKAIQDELKKAKTDAKVAGEAHEKEIKRLKTENEKINGGKDLELSQAFSAGFAAYLQKFLTADPKYDWSQHFAPSTPSYMIFF